MSARLAGGRRISLLVRMSSSSSPFDKAPTLQELRAARGAQPSLWRRCRGLLIAGALLLLLVLFGFFGLPPLVKSQAEQRLGAVLGREVRIETLRLNPLVLSATIEGFAIAEGGAGRGEFTAWRRLYVNFDSWSLLTGGARFQNIELDGFRARVAKGVDGKMNFDDILVKLRGTETSPVKSDRERTSPRPLTIARLVVREAEVAYSDASLERPFSTVAGPLSFELDQFHSVGDPNAPYRFEAVTQAGERLAWQGTLSIDPVRSQGELKLSNIDLARLSPYYHRLIAGDLRSALLDVSGRYRFELRGAEPALFLENGELTLRDLHFGAPGVEHDALTVQRLAITGISADSVARRADVTRVALEGIDLKLERDERGVDLVRMFGIANAKQPSALDPSADPGATTAPLPTLRLGEFSVSKVTVEAVDKTTPRAAVHRIEDLRLILRDLDSTDLAKASPLVLELTLPEGGKVTLDGQVSARPLGAELNLAVEKLGFATASPYLEPFLNVRLAEGQVRAQGRVGLREGALSYVGGFAVAGFRAVDGKQAQDFLSWSDLTVSGLKLTSSPAALSVEELRWVEPRGFLRIEADGSLSIAQAVAAEGRPVVVTASQEKSGSAMPAIEVGRITLEGAAFRFEDRSVRPAARGGIAEFGGTIAGLSSATPTRADVDLRGKVDGMAPILIRGKLNPLGNPAFVDLKLDFKNIDLQPLAGPYVGKYVGRELARGRLNVDITATLRDRTLDAENLVVLDQFFLGEKTNSPEATKLPVGLALALLRDSSGRISLPVPVRGSLDDPEFKIGRVVVGVVVNVLTKAASSPFSLLGAAFGGGGEELGWQDFAAGSAELEAGGIQKLETLARAMADRPALGVELIGAFDPLADEEALRKVLLEQRLRALAWELRRQVDPNAPPPESIVMTPELRTGMLSRLYAEQFPGPGTSATPPVSSAEEPARSILEAGVEPTMERRPVGRLSRFGNVVSGPVTPPVRVTNTEEPPPPEPGDAEMSETVALPSPEEMATRLMSRIVVAEADLQALGEERARVVRAWLLGPGRVAGERVFQAPVAPDGRRVNLNLK